MAQQNVSIQDIQALGKQLEVLRMKYERYFMGIDKLEPTVDRSKMQRAIVELTSSPITNTQVRFQLNQVKAKWITLQSYWSRILRQIEDGTYKRDRFKADLHAKEQADRETRAAVAGGAPSRSAAAAAGGGPGSEALYDKVYQAYLTARERCNESVDGLSRDRIAASLRKQEEKIRAQAPGARPEFKVVIKEGKARIVASTKKAAP